MSVSDDDNDAIRERLEPRFVTSGQFVDVRDAILSSGWIRLPGAVAGDVCKRLRDRGGHPWRPMAEQVGVVRQEGWYCQPPLDQLPNAVALYANELAGALATAFDGMEFPSRFNEVTWQRQTPSVGFVGPHRDQPFYTGVVAVLTLVGSARFSVLSSREPPVEVGAWHTEPGDLVILRGAGLGRAEARCPWHEVARPQRGERETLTLRHSNREPGGRE